jgi:putative aminopeptidase FrvX
MNKQLLFQMIHTFSPSGNEDGVVGVIKQALGGIPVTIRSDGTGNIYIQKGKYPRFAMVTHMDSVGIMLQQQKTKKKWTAVGLGRIKATQKDSIQVKTVNGIVMAKVMETKNTEKPFALSFIENDVFAEVGDVGTYVPSISIDSQMITGTFLDDKIGLMIAFDVLSISDNVCWVLTKKEECGGKTSVYVSRNLPYIPIVILDTTYAKTAESDDTIILGDGPSVTLKDDFLPDQHMVSSILKTAAAAYIPIQKEVLCSGGSDMTGIYWSGMECQYVFMGIPLQYMHSSHEIVSLKDVHQMTELLCQLTIK